MRAATIADDLKAFRGLLRLSNAPLPTLYEAYLRTARAILGMRTAVIGSYSHGIYKVLKLDSSVPVPLVEAEGRPLAELFAEEVVRSCDGIACHHVGEDTSLKRHEIYGQSGFESYIASPIRVNGGLFGMLSLLDPQPRAPFTPEEREFLQLLADNLGRAIEHDRGRKERASDHHRQELDILFATAFADAPIGMALVDLDGCCLQVNTAAATLFGYSEADLVARRFFQIAQPDDMQHVRARVQDLLLGKAHSFQIEKRYVRPDGRSIWIELNVALVEFEDGSPRCFICQMQDISSRRDMAEELKTRQEQLEAANEKLRLLASIDPLTGILNRRALREMLQGEMERARKDARPLGFVMFDVDLFKAYNDTHGHLEGDVALRIVAQCLQQGCRASDILGRFGGEEFLLVLPGATPEQAKDIAERSRLAVCHCPNLPFPLTVSAGVHVFDPSSERDLAGTRLEERPIAAADQALYRAKQAGRNRVEMI